MKKIILGAFAFLFLGSVAFGQQDSTMNSGKTKSHKTSKSKSSSSMDQNSGSSTSGKKKTKSKSGTSSSTKDTTGGM